MERTRLLWLILDKHGLFKPGLRVMHIAPELPLIKRFSELLSDRYYACDIDPSRYSSKFTTMRPLDLTCDLVKIPSCSFDLILHSHVLEHVRCDIESVLREFERILAPGGRHYFAVPVRGDETRENLSDDLPLAERLKQFGQADHYRLFGRRSLPEMLDRVWGPSERHHIEPLELVSAEELEAAAIPKEAWSGISGHTIFQHTRPKLRRPSTEAGGSRLPASVESGNPDRSPRRALSAAFAGTGPKLILHIGMPKTGTTSLQRWLSINRDAALRAGLDYWSIAENHSEAIFTAFASPKRLNKGTMWFQRGAGSRKEDSTAFRKSFDEFLSGLGDRIGYVSAEALWTFGTDDVRNLAAHLQERQVQALILCWIRPPAEFLKTATQQLCRSTLAIGDFGIRFHRKVPIDYRRLTAWTEQFGTERVVTGQFDTDMVGQLQKLLESLEIHVDAKPDSERALNTSISLVAAKALLALNEISNCESPERSRRLRNILQELKGANFQLPDSVLRRMRPAFAKEAEYLAEVLSMDKDWLLAETAGIDDALFFHWDYAEVVSLLSAVNEALSKPDDKKDKKENRSRGNGGG
ncbi:MAG: methyltransferase domain-containing protein [Rhizomicrobium sp.]|jgi:SAM-dependent methyltransferase